MLLGKFVIGTMLVGGVVVMQDGIISVNVREKHPGGHHIWFAAPGSLVPFALKLAPARDLQEHMRDSRQWMPVAKAALDALANSPDGVFVQVDSAEQHVRVQKSWGRLLVDVDDPGEEVHLAIPIRAVRHTLSEMEELQPAS